MILLQFHPNSYERAALALLWIDPLFFLMSPIATSAPVVLKLDMGLVRNIHAEPNKQAVVSGIITMMRQLGGRIVAEGVETPEEYFWFRSQGIALYQGYLFAKPGFECLPEPVFPD